MIQVPTLKLTAALALAGLALAACGGGPSADASELGQVQQPGFGLPAATAPAAGVDRFGVEQLYPSAPEGQSWTLADDPATDPHFDPQRALTWNADGSLKVTGDKVRLLVHTTSGYRPELIGSLDRDALAARGYMQDPADWKNVELTGYVRVNHVTNPTDNLTWYARGARHSAHTPCEGSSYKAGLHYDGRARWEKESWHVAYENSPHQQVTGPLEGRWIGMKSVIRNNAAGEVELELWIDEDGDGKGFTPVYAMSDGGTWGGTLGSCGGSNPATPITWGGPVATFRWDGADDVDVKWLSVREVQPQS